MPTPIPEYCTIPLTQGQVARVDASDYPLLSQFKWTAQWNPCTNSFYAMRKVLHEGKRKTTMMHRVILGLDYGDRRTVDHRNHDTLDNRRHNIRIYTYSENGHNQRLNSKNTSGFQCVNWHTHAGKWHAHKVVRGKHFHLGYYSDPQEASRVIEEFCAANELDYAPSLDGFWPNSAQSVKP